MLRPRLIPITRRADRVRVYSAAEDSAGHRDVRDRAELRADIEAELDMRAWPDSVACEVLGLEQGALSDGSLSTDVLRASLQHLRRQPL